MNNNQTRQYQIAEASTHLERFSKSPISYVFTIESGAPIEMTKYYLGEMEVFQSHIGDNIDKNTYVLIGTAKHELDKMPEKSDMLGSHYVWADFDPPKEVYAEDGSGDLDPIAYEHWCNITINSLTNKPPKGVPTPTIVNFSGRGFWAFWEFPYCVDPNTVESINRWIAKKYGSSADKVHNINRTTRLPGSRNSKTGKIAKVHRYTENLIYEPSDFGRYEAPNSPTIELDPNLQPKTITSIDELGEWDVTPRTCNLLVQGNLEHNESEMKKKRERGADTSRSGWLMDGVTSLLRSGVPKEVVLGIITDQRWKISESVYVQKDGTARPNPMKNALRQIQKGMEFVAVDSENKSNGPRLLAPGNLADDIEFAERVLVDNSPELLQRSGQLVRIATLDRDDVDESTGIRRSRGSAILLPASPHWILEELSRHQDWKKPYKKTTIACDPSKELAKHVLARSGAWEFPHVSSIVSAPTITGNGRILVTPGLDVSTGVFLDVKSDEFPKVPENPSKDDALAALTRVKLPFRGFPFSTEADYSVVISALLCGISRPMMASCPAHVFDAPTAATGKTLLAESIGLMVTGSVPPASSQGKTDEEDEKRLVSVLLKGDQVLLIDNIEKPLRGDFLCSILTQQFVQSRLLGSNSSPTFRTSILVLVTGNNLAIHGDMGRRSALCQLNAKSERPEDRQFKFHPHDEIRENRESLVVDLLTILKAYVDAGRPNRLPTIGSFGDWTDIRSALTWLGMPDPAATRERIEQENPQKQERRQLIVMWERAFGTKPTTVAELDSLAQQKDATQEILDLHNCLLEMTGKPLWSSKSVGHVLRRHRDTIIDGATLESTDGRSGLVWRLHLNLDEIGTTQEKLGQDPPF